MSRSLANGISMPISHVMENPLEIIGISGVGLAWAKSMLSRQVQLRCRGSPSQCGTSRAERWGGGWSSPFIHHFSGKEAWFILRFIDVFSIPTTVNITITMTNHHNYRVFFSRHGRWGFVSSHLQGHIPTKHWTWAWCNDPYGAFHSGTCFKLAFETLEMDSG